MYPGHEQQRAPLLFTRIPHALIKLPPLFTPLFTLRVTRHQRCYNSACQQALLQTNNNSLEYERGRLCFKTGTAQLDMLWRYFCQVQDGMSARFEGLNVSSTVARMIAATLIPHTTPTSPHPAQSDNLIHRVMVNECLKTPIISASFDQTSVRQTLQSSSACTLCHRRLLLEYDQCKTLHNHERPK